MKRKILEVPKIKQLPYYCTPTSLAMVLQYYGLNLSQEKIAKQLKTFKDGFKDQAVLHYARSKGFIAHPYNNFSIDRLIKLIDRDILAIVRVKSSIDNYSAHTSIVKGYDLESKIIFINDPEDLRRSKVDFKKFNSFWNVRDKEYGFSKNYAISIRPKNQQ